MTNSWVEHYRYGDIIKRRDTPRAVLATLRDWADACCDTSCAMWRFAEGKPVKPEKLLQEIDDCLAETSLEPGLKRLRDLQVWAIREGQLAAAAKNLHDARAEFMLAANVAGVDPALFGEVS